MKMYFNSDKAFEFLNAHQHVFTLRASKGLEPATVVDVEIYRHGKPTGLAGKRVYMNSFVDNQTDILEDYVNHTGFKDCKEWLAEAKRLSGQQDLWDLFYVHAVNV